MAYSDELVARTAGLGTATLHEVMGRRGNLPPRIKPLAQSMRVAGPALPVRCPVGDNLFIHFALDRARPGDVLVVDCGEDDAAYGYWGEIMATAALARGVAGLVITGGVRDSLQLIALGLPTFAGGISIMGTGKDATRDGAVGEAVRIGEVVIRRGDLVVGDADGVVLVPQEQAANVISLSQEREAAERVIMEKLRAGASTLDVYKFNGQ